MAADADPNSRSSGGITSLMNAAWFGCQAAVQELIRQGADKNQRANEGFSAFDMALKREHSEIAEYLR